MKIFFKILAILAYLGVGFFVVVLSIFSLVGFFEPPTWDSVLFGEGILLVYLIGLFAILYGLFKILRNTVYKIIVFALLILYIVPAVIYFIPFYLHALKTDPYLMEIPELIVFEKSQIFKTDRYENNLDSFNLKTTFIVGLKIDDESMTGKHLNEIKILFPKTSSRDEFIFQISNEKRYLLTLHYDKNKKFLGCYTEDLQQYRNTCQTLLNSPQKSLELITFESTLFSSHQKMGNKFFKVSQSKDWHGLLYFTIESAEKISHYEMNSIKDAAYNIYLKEKKAVLLEIHDGDVSCTAANEWDNTVYEINRVNCNFFKENYVN